MLSTFFLVFYLLALLVNSLANRHGNPFTVQRQALFLRTPLKRKTSLFRASLGFTADLWTNYMNEMCDEISYSKIGAIKKKPEEYKSE